MLDLGTAGAAGAADAAADSARELREKKRVLAALVVHDLRSPLAAIGGYLELLRGELGDASPDALRHLEDAKTLVGKALGLVATILDVDELEDGILRADPVPVRVAELIEEARVANRAQLEVRELALEVACDPALVVRLDRELFARIFENLVDNACRFAPRGGRCAVAVTVAPGVTPGVAPGAGGTVELAIGNDGPPVPAGDREKIFGRYYQVEARRAAARANRGLGLYFCKLAVEAHGGTIHVEERGELGAVFVVRIPE